jgi:hypothetical protein
MEKYVDGQLFAVQELGQFGLDGRYSLASASLLFADESRDSQPAYVNSIQIRNYLMDGDEMRALGGAAASGIATNISPSLK